MKINGAVSGRALALAVTFGVVIIIASATTCLNGVNGSLNIPHARNECSNRRGAARASSMYYGEQINLTSDAALLKLGTGDGSPENPVRIMDWVIATSGHGIMITNTRLHVIISSCHMAGGSAQSTSGIYMSNCTDVRIIKCNITDFGTGISVGTSKNVVVDDCTITDCNTGLTLSNAMNCEVVKCDISRSTVAGIRLQSNAANNMVSGNTLVENSNDGITCQVADNNTFDRNNASCNGRGIALVASNNNTFTGNIACDNTDCGVMLTASRLNAFSNNNISCNGQWGVSFDESFGNAVRDNVIMDNTNGTIFPRETSIENTIGDNKYFEPGKFGVTFAIMGQIFFLLCALFIPLQFGKVISRAERHWRHQARARKLRREFSGRFFWAFYFQDRSGEFIREHCWRYHGAGKTGKYRRVVAYEFWHGLQIASKDGGTVMEQRRHLGRHPVVVLFIVAAIAMFTGEIYIQCASNVPEGRELSDLHLSESCGSTSGTSTPVYHLTDTIMINYTCNREGDVIIRVGNVYTATNRSVVGINHEVISFHGDIFSVGETRIAICLITFRPPFFYQYSHLYSESVQLIKEPSELTVELLGYKRIAGDQSGYFDIRINGRLTDMNTPRYGIPGASLRLLLYDEPNKQYAQLANVTTDEGGRFRYTFSKSMLYSNPVMAQAVYEGSAVYEATSGDASRDQADFYSEWHELDPFFRTDADNGEPAYDYIISTSTRLACSWDFAVDNQGWSWTTAEGSPLQSVHSSSINIYEWSDCDTPFSGYLSSERIVYEGNGSTKNELYVDFNSNHVINGNPDRYSSAPDTFNAWLEIIDYLGTTWYTKQLGHGTNIDKKGTNCVFINDLSSVFASPTIFYIRIHLSVNVGTRFTQLFDARDVWGFSVNRVSLEVVYPPCAAKFFMMQGMSAWLAQEKVKSAQGDSLQSGIRTYDRSNPDGYIYSPVNGSASNDGIQNYQFSTSPITSPAGPGAFLHGTWSGWTISEGTNASNLYTYSDVSTASVAWRSKEKDVELSIRSVGHNTEQRWASLSTEFAISDWPGFRIQAVRLTAKSDTAVCNIVPPKRDLLEQAVLIEGQDGFGAPVTSTHNAAMGNIDVDITPRITGAGVYDLVFLIVALDWNGFKSVKWHVDDVRITVTYASVVEHYVDFCTRGGGNSMLNIANPVSSASWSGNITQPAFAAPAKINGTARLFGEQHGRDVDGVGSAILSFSWVDIHGTTQQVMLFESPLQYPDGRAFSIPAPVVPFSDMASWSLSCNMTVPGTSVDGSLDSYHVMITSLEAFVQDGNGTWVPACDLLSNKSILTFTSYTADGVVLQRQLGKQSVLSVLADAGPATSPVPREFSATIITPGLELDMAPSKTTSSFTVKYSPVLESSTLSKAQLGGQSGTVTMYAELRGMKAGAYVPLYEVLIADITITNDTNTSKIETFPCDLSDVLGQSRWYDGSYVENYTISIRVDIIERCSVSDVKIGVNFNDFKWVCADLKPEPQFKNLANNSVIAGPAQSIIVQGQGDGTSCLFALRIDGAVADTYNDTTPGIPEVWEWTLDTREFTDTANATFVAQIIDANGQTGYSSTIHVKIDNTPPEVQILTLASNSILKQPVFVNISFSADVKSAIYQIVPHGQSWSSPFVRMVHVDTTPADGFGFTFDITTVPSGMYDFRVLVTDRANWEACDVVTSIFIELLEPTIISYDARTDGNTIIIAASGGGLATRATLAWTLAMSSNASEIPDVEWHSVKNITAAANDTWIFQVTDAEIGPVDDEIYWRVRFYVSNYSECCYAAATIDTISPAPVLSWSAGSEPGAGGVFRGITALNMSASGTHLGDVEFSTLSWHSGFDNTDTEIRSWTNPVSVLSITVPITAIPPDASGTFILASRDDMGRVGIATLDVIIDNNLPIIAIHLPRPDQHIPYNASVDESVNVSVMFRAAVQDVNIAAFTYAWRHVASTTWTPFAPVISSPAPAYYAFTWSIANASIIASLPCYQVRITAVDIHGATYTSMVSFWIDAFQDNLAPYIVIGQPQASVIFGEKIIFNFTAGDDNNVTDVSIWSGSAAPLADPCNVTNLIATLSPGADGKYYYELASNAISLESAVHRMVIRVLDQSLNAREIAIDVTVALPGINVTDGATYQASGAARVFAPAVYLAETDVDNVSFELSTLVSGSWVLVGNQSTPFTGITSGEYMLRVHYRQNASIAGRLDAWYTGARTIEFTIDNTIPTDLVLRIGSASAPAIANGTVLSNSIKFFPSAYDDAGIAIYAFYLNTTLVCTGEMSPAGISWTVTGFPEGSAVLYFEATDAVGNIARSSSFAVIIDSSPAIIMYQAITGYSPSGNSTYTTGTISISVSVVDDMTPISNIVLSWSRASDGASGVAWQASPGTNSVALSATIALKEQGLLDGQYKLRFVITSGGGILKSTKIWTVILDSVVPACTFEFPSNYSLISGTSATFAVNAADITSGVARVEFHLGSILLNATRIGAGVLDLYLGLYTFKYKFTENYQGDVIAAVTDTAGLSAVIAIHGIVLNYSLVPGMNVSSGSILGSPVSTSGPALPGTTVTLSYHEFTADGIITWVPLGSDTVTAGQNSFQINWDTNSIVASGLQSSWLPIRIDDTWSWSGGGVGNFDGDNVPDVAFVVNWGNSFGVFIYEAVTPHAFSQIAYMQLGPVPYCLAGSIRCDIADVDGDGIDEIVLLHKSGDYWFFTVYGSTLPRLHLDISTTIYALKSPADVREMVCYPGNPGGAYIVADDKIIQVSLNVDPIKAAGPLGAKCAMFMGQKTFAERPVTVELASSLWFATERTFGYFSGNFGQYDCVVKVVDAAPEGFTIKAVKVGNIDGDIYDDVLVAVSSAVDSYILAYAKDGASTWSTSVVKKYPSPVSFSAMDVSLATGSFDSVVVATSTSVSELVQRSTAIQDVTLIPGGSGNFVDTYKGLLDYRKVTSPAQSLPDSSFGAREDLETPSSSYTINDRDSSISFTGDSRQASGRVGSPGTVTTSQGGLVDGYSRLGFDQFGSYQGGQQEYFENYAAGADIQASNSRWTASSQYYGSSFSFTATKRDANSLGAPRGDTRGCLDMLDADNYYATYQFPSCSDNEHKALSIAVQVSENIGVVNIGTNSLILVSINVNDMTISGSDLAGIYSLNRLDSWIILQLEFSASDPGKYRLTVTQLNLAGKAMITQTLPAEYSGYNQAIQDLEFCVTTLNNGQLYIDDILAGWIDVATASRHQVPDSSGYYYAEDDSICTLTDFTDNSLASVGSFNALGYAFTARSTTIDVVRVQPISSMAGATIKLYPVSEGIPVVTPIRSHVITNAEWHAVVAPGTIDFHVDFTGLEIGTTYAITFETSASFQMANHWKSPNAPVSQSSGHLVARSLSSFWSAPVKADTTIGTAAEHPVYGFDLNIHLIPDITKYRVPTENGVVINEVCTGPEGSRYIELANYADEAQDLRGWKITMVDKIGAYIFTFPAFVLQPGSIVVVHEEAGMNTATEVYDPVSKWNKLASSTFFIDLMTGTSIVVDYFRTDVEHDSVWDAVPPTGPWFGKASAGSWCTRIADTDTNTASDWAVKSYGTAGQFNAPFQDGKVMTYQIVSSHQDTTASYERDFAPRNESLIDGDYTSGTNLGSTHTTVIPDARYGPTSMTQVDDACTLSNPVDNLNSYVPAGGWAVHYSLDGNANDAAGYKNGILHGTCSFSSTTKRFGQSMYFDGSSTYIDTEIMRELTNYSMGAWIYPTELHGFSDFSGFPVINTDWSWRGGVGFGVSYQKIHVLLPAAINWAGGGLPRFLQVDVQAIVENEWHFIAVSILRADFNDFTYYHVEVYVDGEPVYRDTKAGHYTPAFHETSTEFKPFQIGVDQANAGRFFKGYMDDVFIMKSSGSSFDDGVSFVRSLYAPKFQPFTPINTFTGIFGTDASFGGGLSAINDDDANYGVIQMGSRFPTRLNFDFDLENRISNLADVQEIKIVVNGYAVGYKMCLVSTTPTYEGVEHLESLRYIAGYYLVPFTVSSWADSSGTLSPAARVQDVGLGTGHGRSLWQSISPDMDQNILADFELPSDLQPEYIFGGFTKGDNILPSGAVEKTSPITDSLVIQSIIDHGLSISFDPWTWMGSVNHCSVIHDIGRWGVDYWSKSANVYFDKINNWYDPHAMDLYDPAVYTPIDTLDDTTPYEDAFVSQCPIQGYYTGENLPQAMIFLDDLYIEVVSKTDTAIPTSSSPNKITYTSSPVSVPVDISIPVGVVNSLDKIDFEVYIKVPTTVIFSAGMRMTSGPYGSYGKVRYGMEAVESFKTLDDLTYYPWEYWTKLTTFTPFYDLTFSGSVVNLQGFDYDSKEWKALYYDHTTFDASVVPGSSDLFCIKFTLTDEVITSERRAFDDLRLGDNQGRLMLKIQMNMDVEWAEQSIDYIDTQFRTTANYRAFNTFDIYQTYILSEIKTFAHSKTTGSVPAFPGASSPSDGQYSEHQVVLDFPASALPFDFDDIQSVDRIWIDFNAMLTVSWFNYMNPMQTTFGYGYSGTPSFTGMEYAFGVEIYDFTTGAWVTILSPKTDTGAYITAALPSGRRTKQISVWRSRSPAFPLDHFVTEAYGLRLRFTAVFDWGSTALYNFDSLKEIGNIENAVKQTNFMVSQLAIDLQYKQNPAPMQITDDEETVTASLTLPATTLLAKIGDLASWSSYASQVHATGTLDLSVDLMLKNVARSDVSALDVDIALLRVDGANRIPVTLVNVVSNSRSETAVNTRYDMAFCQVFTATGTMIHEVTIRAIRTDYYPSRVHVALTTLDGDGHPDFNNILHEIVVNYDDYWLIDDPVAIIPFVASGLAVGSQYGLILYSEQGEGGFQLETTTPSDGDGYVEGYLLTGYWTFDGISTSLQWFSYLENEDLVFEIEMYGPTKHVTINDFPRGSGTLTTLLQIPEDYIYVALGFDPAATITGAEDLARHYEINVLVSNGMWNGYSAGIGILDVVMPTDTRHCQSTATYYVGDNTLVENGVFSREFTITMPADVPHPDPATSLDLATARYLLFETATLVDFWCWGKSDGTGTSIKGSTPASLYAFLLANGGDRSSLLQVYNTKTGSWFDMLCGIDEAYIWDVLQLDPANPASWVGSIQKEPFPFEFLYYDGSSKIAAPVSDFIRDEGNSVKVKINLDYKGYMASHGAVGYAACAVVEDLETTAYFDNIAYGEQEQDIKSRPFSAEFTPEAGYTMSDVAGIEVLCNGQNLMQFTYGKTDIVGGNDGTTWFTATTVAQSFMATCSVLSSISFKAKGYTDTSRFTATVYPEMIVPGLREVTLVDFPDIGAQGIYDESYLVVESSSGERCFIWFDYNGDGIWTAEPYVSKTLDDVIIRVNVAGLHSDEAIAVAFMIACETSLKSSGFILTNNGDGTVSITHDAEGLVPHVKACLSDGTPMPSSSTTTP
nr:NosD domain-containing protein [Candidatus Sigynarchaeota archaeon]